MPSDCLQLCEGDASIPVRFYGVESLLDALVEELGHGASAADSVAAEEFHKLSEAHLTVSIPVGNSDTGLYLLVGEGDTTGRQTSLHLLEGDSTIII